MPESMKRDKLFGSHFGKSNKAILLNMDAINGDVEVFIDTLLHEAEHAKQEKEYNEILKISPLKRTKEQQRKIRNLKKCNEVSKRKNDYYNEHKKLLSPILEITKNLTREEAKKYVSTLRPIQQLIFDRYLKLYDDYKYSLNEIYARQAGKKAVERYFNEKETKGLVGRGQRSVSFIMGRPQEWGLGTGHRNSSQRRGQENQRIFKDEIEELNSHIPDDIDEILPKVKKPSDKVFQKIITSISTRLENISPRIKHAVRKFEFDSALTENKYAETVKPFIDNLSKMPEFDYAKYDLALKNGNVEEINRLNQKYNLVKEFKNVKSLLDEIREKALNVGFNIGYVSDYFPSVLKMGYKLFLLFLALDIKISKII